ncbi:MAG TPA: hybrid sensor histidine kinase/response regulator [Bacteroidales bacterium]|nr:hybrid sensor histidine kinase/response regulator [Bacteroidales bacterium]
MDVSKNYKSKNPVILIVDDNPYNLQILGKLLQEELLSVEFATNGEGALEWLSRKYFDLVLLDISMPGMNGFDVCREIRKIKKYDNLPVIFLTANTERESILHGFDIGAQDYITKPFDSRELLSRVKTHLKLKFTIEELENLNDKLEDLVAERTAQLSDANKKLELLNEKLLDLDRAKSEFLNLISHEIRTPLNGMVGPIELIKESNCSTEIGALVEILDSSVQRLEQFSVNALLITRLKTKPDEIHANNINIHDVIESVLADLREKIVTRNINVEVSKNEGAGLVRGERELLTICIRNIVDNALKFSPVSGDVKLSVESEDDFVTLTVSDAGEGFREEMMDEVFKIFVFGDTKQDNAPGLGLPLAKMILESHKGNIFISNNKAKGANVEMKFPAS